jgi:hypothetical protein
MAEQRVKLAGGYEHSANWAEIRADGSLVIELFDFSPEAHDWLGNDVAYFLIVAPPDKAAVLQRLASEAGKSCKAGDDQQLLKLIHARFPDYFAVKKWLAESGIPFTKDFDGRA